MITREKAYKLRELIEKLSAFLSDEEALLGIELFPRWNGISIEYKAEDRVCYNGLIYKCLTDHTSQSTWTPSDSPSLWVRIDNPEEEYPEWIQPVGSTDDYSSGSKVSHNNKHWISNVDNNVWEPGVYGWNEVT